MGTTTQISSKHHYLPRFYIKNFCNSKGEIKISLRREQTFNEIRTYHPANIFFSSDRNTFEVDGLAPDQLEKYYSDIDNHMAVIFDRLLKDEVVKGKIEVETLRTLIHFGYFTKWRVPKIDQYFELIKRTVSFSSFGINAMLGTSKIDLEELYNDEVSQELKRFLLSGVLFSDQELYQRVFKDCFILSFPQPLLLSDSPFLEDNRVNVYGVPAFILPLSSNLALFYSEKVNKSDFLKFVDSEDYNEFNYSLYSAIQAAMVLSTSRYIGCEDKKTLQHFVELVPEIQKSTSKNLGHFPFDILNSYTTFKKKG
ncbi:hypothetical protein BCY89_27670 [Sphingobacterium siyangense]|uniref:DUF4238 domain-containing protein n=1 Tax=Sphingobacterium siyangense TaxID=459529 RepID=A0A420FXL1_9SPHI|nr:DUF4238 domain-containing protein [Sphingobacterium siyangense]RKF37660.1 hypothetical protein BCY89_27670 [Sphingobacterium siyangense]